MKKKFLNYNLILIFVPILFVTLAVFYVFLSFFSEKINPYNSVELAMGGGMGGYFESYTFERDGLLCRMYVTDRYDHIDSEDKIIPGFIYYPLIFYVASMKIESINGYTAYGSCTDGFTTGIHMERKDGIIVDAYAYEAEFPDGKDVKRLYRIVSACANKDFKNMVIREIKYSKTYREIYLQYRNLQKKLKKMLKN